MSTPYSQFADLLREVEPPPDGTLSRTLHQDERLKAVLFGFAAGQELSEHTSSKPAVMHFLKGEATVTLGDDQAEVGPGAWIHMAAGLRHSIRTRTWAVSRVSEVHADRLGRRGVESREAFRAARALAQSLGAGVVVFHIISPPAIIDQGGKG